MRFSPGSHLYRRAGRENERKRDPMLAGGAQDTVCRRQPCPKIGRALRLFGKRAAPLSEDERQVAAVDLERVGRGGMPLGAGQRLKRLAAASSPFSSALSAKEYALAQVSGVTSLAQVMGAPRSYSTGGRTTDGPHMEAGFRAKEWSSRHA